MDHQTNPNPRPAAGPYTVCWPGTTIYGEPYQTDSLTEAADLVAARAYNQPTWPRCVILDGAGYLVPTRSWLGFLNTMRDHHAQHLAAAESFLAEHGYDYNTSERLPDPQDPPELGTAETYEPWMDEPSIQGQM